MDDNDGKLVIVVYKDCRTLFRQVIFIVMFGYVEFDVWSLGIRIL